MGLKYVATVSRLNAKTGDTRRTRGFTLIEMSIVVVVIGLLLSGGITAIGPIIESSKISETKGRLDRIEQALVLHVIRYGCLPCPATAGTASTVATVGQAVAGGTPYTSGCQAGACTNAQGVVPWVNLEISEAEASDAFDNRFSYALTATLQNTNGMVRTPPATYPAGTLVVNTAAAVQVTAAAAYVLISHGPDKAYGFANGTAIQAGADPGASTHQLANSNGTPFVQDELIKLPGNTYFDDLVRWRSAPVIIQLCGSNACGNPA